VEYRWDYYICTEEELIGKRFNIEKDLKEALEGNPSHSVTELDEKENEHLKADNKKLIEIYYPVENENGKIIGAFEIYKSYERIKEYDHSMTVYIWLIIFGGLLILYMLLFKSIRSTYLTLKRQNNELKEINNELQRSYLDTIEAFSTAVDLKDSYTKDHSSRVTEYSLKIAEEMNLDRERVGLLKKAALFHDIGKIGIPDAILKKESKLTDEEYALIKQHPMMGAKLIESVNFLHEIIPFIKGHHERMDGKGYPQVLKGNEIPLEARIIAVADTFDAMTSDRPYRKGMDFEMAITELQRVGGTQLDGELVEVFIKVLRKR
jgi:putative nucleotidyltransferase with HDIG domain